METVDALQKMIQSTGESNRAVSVAMGRSANYVNSAIEQSKRKGGGLNSLTLANAADVCDYALALVPKDDLPDSAITIDAS